MKTLLVVVTCPRPAGKHSYLEDTVRALDAEGADACDHKNHMLHGQQARVSSPGWSMLCFPGPSGSRRAVWRVFRLAHEMQADRLLLVEDDVLPCKNAVSRMATFEVPDEHAFVTFHDMRYYPQGGPPGLWSRKFRGGVPKDFCGNQCLLIPRRTVTYLVAQDPFEVPDEEYWSARSSADCVMGYLLDRSPWPTFGVHLPCLVEHVGAVSAAHPGDPLERAKTTSFAGREFDALTLQF